MEEIRQAGVIGAGTMGAGIAQVLAQAGITVMLCDVDDGRLARGMESISKNLDRAVCKGSRSAESAAESFSAIRTTVRSEDLAGCGLVIEAATERWEIKREIFRSLDRILGPEAILASNTSSISIDRLAAETGRPERVAGMHFFNPVPVMTLIELVRGARTSEETCRRIQELAARLGKTAVEVRDAPGFVSNRVLMPLINEAAYAVMEGVATPEAVDEIFRLGMAHPMGPLALADLIGLDVCQDILRVIEEGLGDPKFHPCPLLTRMVQEGRLGRKSGEGFYRYE
ncbi:MAG TPA: 3-hydroxyacyl-CoA dehydrogenase NAD-binding domain-containing protein [Acidobacteriaceae bacterium]|jgi:3-hydroxybutyryl-CoA dehydrogenase|nr:3-hydroxyacyl-CoA dehydrogenase NAD-binding domain-containing protein [Acidobacteriaceae bacterium]